MKELLETYRHEMEEELSAILSFWLTHTIDQQHGGYVGRIDHQGKIYADAPKGSVLNSRILWTFSAAYRHTKNNLYLEAAKRACHYLLHHFIDKEYGGVYWTVDAKGEPLDTKKQIYALSFAVYGLTEFYRATGDAEALKAAQGLYSDIITHSHDREQGGYIEALSREWQELGDLRLSAKDANERKSMNTHLHVLEAFANLYRVAPNQQLKGELTELVRLFLDHIIDPNDAHLVLFFDDNWQRRSGIVSYGHDIEAAWLVQEAAELLDDKALLEEVKEASLRLANAAAEGLDEDGGLWYEYDTEKDHWIRQKHSWPQAEAMVGFLNAAGISGDEKYIEQSWRSWKFVQAHIRDEKGGEWFWGIEADGSPMTAEDKAGIWKCPYHNSRACLEVIHRIDKIFAAKTLAKHEKL